MPKKFGVIPYFLVIVDDRAVHPIFEKISVLPKVYSTNRVNRQIHFCFLPVHVCVLPIHVCVLPMHF